MLKLKKRILHGVFHFIDPVTHSVHAVHSTIFRTFVVYSVCGGFQLSNQMHFEEGHTQSQNQLL